MGPLFSRFNRYPPEPDREKWALIRGSYTVGFTSPVGDALVRELDLSADQSATASSIITVSAMLGALAAGKLADRAGRKRCGCPQASCCF
jgi:MFS family permease